VATRIVLWILGHLVGLFLRPIIKKLSGNCSLYLRKLWTDFVEIWQRVRRRIRDQPLRFWWQFNSKSESDVMNF